jgi:uncharacterized protein
VARERPCATEMGAIAKFLLVVAVIVLVGWLLFGGRRRRHASRELPAPEGMLRCAHCGVHLPASEALQLGKDAFCSAAHRDAGPRAFDD